MTINELSEPTTVDDRRDAIWGISGRTGNGGNFQPPLPHLYVDYVSADKHSLCGTAIWRDGSTQEVNVYRGQALTTCRVCKMVKSPWEPLPESATNRQRRRRMQVLPRGLPEFEINWQQRPLIEMEQEDFTIEEFQALVAQPAALDLTVTRVYRDGTRLFIFADDGLAATEHLAWFARYTWGRIGEGAVPLTTVTFVYA